ncbi:hypothetical protein TRICI_006139 [Trichomonascus ciferrii]|uniref:Uncharacterized protein n=1 Tax=Trichomonascus ciferrii TaxID=44093 RepID=A0A642UKM0_9ASCO|nr:hypothetical protein TRICI_006139 [Trichomonascus ciferrii]
MALTSIPPSAYGAPTTISGYAESSLPTSLEIAEYLARIKAQQAAQSAPDQNQPQQPQTTHVSVPEIPKNNKQ